MRGKGDTDIEKAMQLMGRHPGHIAVTVKGGLCLTKTKFLCPKESTVGEFTNRLRQFSEGVRKEDALFLLTETQILPSALATLGELWVKETTEHDPVLRLILCKENAFGNVFTI